MSISLNTIVDVDVQVTTPSAVSSDFTLGLIVGNSAAIVDDVVKVYNYQTYQTAMIADGFTAESPEYIAAGLYFSQSPHSSAVAIGAVGDSTPDVALTTIRSMNEAFYSVAFAYALTADQVKAVAGVVEGFAIPTAFYYYTSDTNAIAAGQSNIIKTIQDLNYMRSFGFYATDYKTTAAFIGLVSGLSSLNVNSAYTAAYKVLVGVDAIPLNDTQLTNLVSYNGNVFTNFGNRYNFTYPAISANGYHVDELFLIDAARTLIQQNTVAGMVSMKKVPLTDSGVETITSFVAAGCEVLASAGFIASGIWTGSPVLNLNTGDAVESGYVIQTGSVADLSAADRAARKSPPIYVCLLASGAIEHVIIRVYVNR